MLVDCPLFYTVLCTSLKPRLDVKENVTVQVADAGVTIVTNSKLWIKRSR